MEQSNFSEQEYDNLLQFAGLCTDIESQAKWKKKLSTIQTAMAECIPLSQDSVQ